MSIYKVQVKAIDLQAAASEYKQVQVENVTRCFVCESGKKEEEKQSRLRSNEDSQHSILLFTGARPRKDSRIHVDL